MYNTVTGLRIHKISITFGIGLIFLCCACQPVPTISNLIQFHDVQGLTTFLIDPAHSVYERKQAAEALGELGDPAAVEPLIQTLNTWVTAGTNDLDEIGTVAVALGKLGDARAVEPLIAALQAKRWKMSTKRDIIAALGSLRDSRAVMPLIQSLLSKGEYESSSYDTVLSALNGIGDSAFVPLTEALPGLRDECLRHKAVTAALGWSTNPTTQSVLEVELKAPEQCSRQNAAEALYVLFKRDVHKLLPYLKSKETVAIYAQVIHAGQTGTETALIAALKQFGDKKMAQAYLNSGNSLLTTAAKDWAAGHGFYIQSLPGGGGQTWGK